MSYSNPSLVRSKEKKRPFFQPVDCRSTEGEEEARQAPLRQTGKQQRFFCCLDGTSLNFPCPISHLLIELCSQSHTAT